MEKPTTIDEYIAGCKDSIRPLLVSLRRIINEEALPATEKISYGMPTWYLKENLVHFAAQTYHIGLYPNPSAIDAFSSELKGYSCSKGTIRLPLDKPLPEQLIRNIVRFRVQEVLHRR